MSQATTSASVSVSNGTRLKKRMRTSDAEDELSTATRSEKYWFEEGNVILHVPDTLFRVHRGVLARHSTVVNESFPVLQPDEKVQQNTMLDGCPVVYLGDDKVEDWERMLAVIYDRDASYKGKGKRSVETLISLLCLGKKYQFDGIFNDVMQRLHEIIPTTLARWADFPEEFENSMLTLYRLTTAVLEVGDGNLLPTLFFLCACFTVQLSAIFQLSAQAGIPQTIVQNFVIARERITARCAEAPFAWVFGFKNQQNICQQPVVCQHAKQQYLQQSIALLKPWDTFLSGNEVLADESLIKVCRGCKAGIRSAHEAHRTAMWDKLPLFFDLPPWAELQNL